MGLDKLPISTTMQKQQGKLLFIITLVGLGIIGAVFALVAWLLSGGGSVTPTSSGSDTESRSDTDVGESSSGSVAAAQGEQLGSVQNVPQGLFNYGGSTTWIPIHEPTQQAIASAFPEFQLRYTLPSGTAPGSGTGISMLLDGQLSFSESSRPVKTEEFEAAQQRGFGLEQIPAAIDAIAIAVHPNLGIEGLTVSQIQDIYTGAVQNWADLGGPDLPISVYSRPPEAAGTAQYFLESIVDSGSYGENVVFVNDTTTGLREVLSNRGGIYYASAPELVNQCSIYAIPIAPQEQPDNFVAPFAGTWRRGQDCLSQPNTINNDAFRDGSYPLTRRLFVVVKLDGSSDEAAGRAYTNMLLTDQGQALIEATGFVGIR